MAENTRWSEIRPRGRSDRMMHACLGRVLILRDGQISWFPKILSGRRGRRRKGLATNFLKFRKFSLPADPNHFYIHHCPVPSEGRWPTSSTWGGMRWTRVVPLTNGADAYGQVVSF